MAFRADESANSGFEQALRVLASTSLHPSNRDAAERELHRLVGEFGPVVQAYPTWHPLVPQSDPSMPVTVPSDRCGYVGLDHTVLFANAFVTCPYGDGKEVFRSVDQLRHRCAEISADRLDVELYSEGTSAILVRCNWGHPLDTQHMIPKRIAVPLMIEEELRAWQTAEVAERWETMRPYLLGIPHGSRSSLFVTQDTALAMKRAYMAMVESGMFGPLSMSK